MSLKADKPARRTVQNMALFLGPLVSLGLMTFLDLSPGRPQATRLAAVALLMAVWWITEAVPLAVTALLPVALFPFLGIMACKIVSSHYFNDIVFLFIGGFMLALAMERWGLHKRIALRTILLIGMSPRRILFGFMSATAFLSMWISNTATAMIMMPIALALTLKLEESFGRASLGSFHTALFLGIAYAASIGGMATLVGTPPNLVLAKILAISFPQAPEISFGRWFLFAFPFSCVFLFLTWVLLISMFGRDAAFKGNSEVFEEEYAKLGRMRFEELAVLLAFVVTACLWLFRKEVHIGRFYIPGWSGLFPEPDFIADGAVAVAGAIALFLVPARAKGEFIMNWETALKLPWGIVLLFGGGFALAAGFTTSGLSVWMGERLGGLKPLHIVCVVVCICTLMTFLTELTSNTATTQIVLPILASLSLAIQVDPLLLMVPATMSASCAFMLPVATPPNAIVFGSGRLRAQDMAKAGMVLNLLGVALVTATLFLWGRFIMGIAA